MPTPKELLEALDKNNDAIKQLADALVKYTNRDPDPRNAFRRVIQFSNLPGEWQDERIGLFSGNAKNDALFLFKWAIGKGVNKEDGRYTAIGSLLRELLTVIDIEDDGRQVAFIIVTYCLYRDKDLLAELMMKYNIPLPAEGTGGLGCGGASISLPMGGRADVGPPITWRGTVDDVTLESWFSSAPDFYDVGFWKRATERADGVCLIKLEKRGRTGTGFLVAPDLLVSNYHVFRDLIKGETVDDMKENLREAEVLFKYVTSEDGTEEAGMKFKLTPEEVLVAESTTKELDFVLLRVEEAIKDADGLKPIRYKPLALGIGSGLNIIQHPAGDTMKIALSSNKVAYTGQEGIIQYASKTTGGSSGSPCFNDKWELVALHHASVATTFGSRREGILFDHIYPRIKDKL